LATEHTASLSRCLHCGAPRTQDVCAACGLDSHAAEMALRRTFARRTAVFLVGALAFVLLSGRYPPLELDGMLIFGGVLFFLTLWLGIWLERRAVLHREVEALKRVYFGLVPIPWLIALLLVGNGAFDSGKPVDRLTSVVSKVAIHGPFPTRRLVVRSWRNGHQVERLSVGAADFDRFQPGDIIVVHVQSGLVGIPWVHSVSCHWPSSDEVLSPPRTDSGSPAPGSSL
jgi:hypothetical protein